MVAYSVPFGRTSGLIHYLPLGQAIVPAHVAQRLAGFERNDAGEASVAALVVVAQLMVGAWLARGRGHWCAIYVAIVLLISCGSSFVFHALFRA
jgi:hypothetical protein